MVDVGARIELESERVGIEPRAGTVLQVTGAQLRVRWDDGHETSIVPGPGALRIISDGRSPAGRPARRAGA
jgi:hypothetical protein